MNTQPGNFSGTFDGINYVQRVSISNNSQVNIQMVGFPFDPSFVPHYQPEGPLRHAPLPNFWPSGTPRSTPPNSCRPTTAPRNVPPTPENLSAGFSGYIPQPNFYQPPEDPTFSPRHMNFMVVPENISSPNYSPAEAPATRSVSSEEFQALADTNELTFDFDDPGYSIFCDGVRHTSTPIPFVTGTGESFPTERDNNLITPPPVPSPSSNVSEKDSGGSCKEWISQPSVSDMMDISDAIRSTENPNKTPKTRPKVARKMLRYVTRKPMKSKRSSANRTTPRRSLLSTQLRINISTTDSTGARAGEINQTPEIVLTFDLARRKKISVRRKLF